MRLICPNCGAQYEVADEIIPAAGRDVQCSNCGHTWLEAPGASEAAEAAIDSAPPHDPDPAPPIWDDDDGGDDLGPAPQPPANRPELDPSVADILREEAARESAARRGISPDPIERQDDLGLEDPVAVQTREQRNIEAARRITRRIEPEVAATPPQEPTVENSATAAAAAAAASRKELLPDIEEINSTLRSSAERGEDIQMTPEEIVQTKRRGFRFGFYTVLLFILILWLAYIFADPLKAIIPSVADPIESYVETVDNMRLWLDLKVQGLTASIEDTTPPASE